MKDSPKNILTDAQAIIDMLNSHQQKHKDFIEKFPEYIHSSITEAFTSTKYTKKSKYHLDYLYFLRDLRDGQHAVNLQKQNGPLPFLLSDGVMLRLTASVDDQSLGDFLSGIWDWITGEEPDKPANPTCVSIGADLDRLTEEVTDMVGRYNRCAGHTLDLGGHSSGNLQFEREGGSSDERPPSQGTPCSTLLAQAEDLGRQLDVKFQEYRANCL